MFYVDNPTGVPVMPPLAPVISQATLYFTEGGNGIPPTYPGPEWFNIVQSELINVIKEAGMLPVKAELNQLLMAIKRINGTALAEDALMKVRNGADIPDKDLFMRNIGALPVTGGTINGDLSVTGTASISALKANKILSHNAATPIEFGLANQVSGSHYWDIHTTYPEIDYDYRIAFNHAVNRIDLLSKTGYAGLNIGGLALRSMQIENVDRKTGNGLIANYDPSGKLACNYGYYHGFFSVNFYDEKTGAWVSNPAAIKPNGDCFFGAVMDNGQRVYSPHNPQPINLTGWATQQWVLQNFVQSIDLTAPFEAELWDGRGYLRPTDGAAMYNLKMVGGANNVGHFILRYTRRLVNNTWYVLN